MNKKPPYIKLLPYELSFKELEKIILTPTLLDNYIISKMGNPVDTQQTWDYVKHKRNELWQQYNIRKHSEG